MAFIWGPDALKLPEMWPQYQWLYHSQEADEDLGIHTLQSFPGESSMLLGRSSREERAKPRWGEDRGRNFKGQAEKEEGERRLRPSSGEVGTDQGADQTEEIWWTVARECADFARPRGVPGNLRRPDTRWSKSPNLRCRGTEQDWSQRGECKQILLGACRENLGREATAAEGSCRVRGVWYVLYRGAGPPGRVGKLGEASGEREERAEEQFPENAKMGPCGDSRE